MMIIQLQTKVNKYTRKTEIYISYFIKKKFMKRTKQLFDNEKRYQ